MGPYKTLLLPIVDQHSDADNPKRGKLSTKHRPEVELRTSLDFTIVYVQLSQARIRHTPPRCGCAVKTFHILRQCLARLLHCCFLGSGSFFTVKAVKSGIETRQYLDCRFLSGNQGRNYKSVYSEQAGLLISKPACFIIEHIKKAHVFQK